MWSLCFLKGHKLPLLLEKCRNERLKAFQRVHQKTRKTRYILPLHVSYVQQQHTFFHYTRVVAEATLMLLSLHAHNNAYSFITHEHISQVHATNISNEYMQRVHATNSVLDKTPRVTRDEYMQRTHTTSTCNEHT